MLMQQKAGCVIRRTVLGSALVLAGCPRLYAAEECVNKDALGTARVMTVDTKSWVGFGKNSGLPRLPLGFHEYVLTMDDGPADKTTTRNLETLRAECVRATFFMVGKRAAHRPDLVKQIVRDGHTIASHSWDHIDLSALDDEAAKANIQAGYRAVEAAAYGAPLPEDAPRFFRYPSFKEVPGLRDWAFNQHITIAAADITPQDWQGMPPEVTLARLDALLDQNDRGVILLHEGQVNTVAFLPKLLTMMKERGLKIVQIVAK